MTAQPSVDAASPAIEARDFSFWYGERKTLHEVTLQVAPRAVTAIIGPSGCGKSTFLRCLNRMNDLVADTRTEGALLVEGRAVYGAGLDLVAHRQRVGMVFQRPNPFPKSIYENVAYGPALNALVPKRDCPTSSSAACAARPLGRGGPARARRALRRAATRLCIARALANEPTVLMDEPFALDPIATLKVEELIFELKQDYTIVIVTHNMQQAARVASRTGFFEAGRLVEMGDTQQIFTSPRHERTEAYITGRFG
jgi:phosphate transport system ATP-binding protein